MGRLSREGDKIKFVDVRFKKGQILGFSTNIPKPQKSSTEHS